MSSTSRVRVYMACSLDGFIAGPDHDLSFLEAPPPPGSPSHDADGALGFEEFMGQVGAMLMGRGTFDVVAGMGVWPYGDTPVLVSTHRPLPNPAPTVRAVAGEMAELVAQARAAAGDKDVYLDGGALVRQAIDAGLVDELCITMLPTLLGDGISLWAGLAAQSQWVLVDHKRMGHMVQLTLRPR